MLLTWELFYSKHEKPEKGFCSLHLLHPSTLPSFQQRAPPAAPGELFTQGNSCDKGTKIARNDGKHFVDRHAEKRGNKSVRKAERGGGGCSRRPGIPSRPQPQWRLGRPWGRRTALHTRPAVSTLPYIALPAPRTWRPKWAAPTASSGMRRSSPRALSGTPAHFK